MAITYRSVLASGGGGIEVDSLTVTTLPTKTSYIEGETIDTTGMVVTAVAGPLSGNVASYCTVTPQVLTTPGTQTITVSYGGQTATFNVTVAEVTLSITTPPTVTEYMVGETLDLTGIVVTATAGGSTTDVTSQCTFSPADGSTITTSGSITITATLGLKSATTTVTAYAATGISITTPPTKTSYRPNDTLDLTGIVVTATAGNVTRNVTSSCTFSPANGTVLTTEGTFTLTASWNGFTATTTYKVTNVTLVSWSTGTDAEIAEMVAAYYNGNITLADIQTVWSVGDERTVSLAAMAATGVGESHAAQSVTFTIMNFGGKKLSSDHSTDVLAVIGQKNFLANGTTREAGFMNSSESNTGGWDACERRTWCNSVYKNAIPSDFRALFKQFDNVTANGSGNTPATSADYFALPSEKEVYGTTTFASATAEASNSQFKYYETAANRIKYPGDSGQGSAYAWWERSPRSDYTNSFAGTSAAGTANSGNANFTRALAPFGCI